MKKKLLSLVIFVVAICMSLIGAGITYVSAAESTEIEANSANYFDNVNRSVKLREETVSLYIERTAEHNDKEFTVYSENFAGVFIDEKGLLNIAVVGEPQKKSRNDGHVIYKQFMFSYNYLQKLMNAIEDIMKNYSIRAVGIDDLYNHVFVELNETSDVAKIIEYLQKQDLYEATALSFEVDPDARTVQDADTAFGGESVSHRVDATTISRGTIGVNAICNVTGRIGILTNEHVAPLGATMNYRGHFNTATSTFSRNIALGDPLRAQNGGTVDASFVPFATQQNWAATPYGKYDTTAYANVRLGTENQITRGQPVMRIGQTTGVTTGEIRSTNVAETVGGIRKTNLFRYTNDGQGGDSGGPVYYNDGTNLHLLGLHFASGDVLLDGRQGIACRISNIMTALDVTIITNDSFNTTNLSSGGIELNQVNFNTTGAFVIPSALGGRNVTSIGASAFSNQNAITRIVIPTTVTEIKNSAFANRAAITEVIFEPTSNLTTIGNSAFSGCTSMSILTIPSSATSIGPNAFENCTSLTSVTLPNNLISIGSAVFKGGTNLNNIIIPNSVTSIDPNSFENCTNLASVTLPNNLISIGSAAFKGCSNLNNITIPSSVTYIGSNAFDGCSSLNNVIREFNYDISTTNCYYLIRENLNNDFLVVNGKAVSNTNDIVPLYLSIGNHSIKVQGANISSVMSAPVLEEVEQLFTNSNKDIKSSVESGKNVFYFHNFARRFVTFTLEASGYSPSDYENAIVVRDLNGTIEKFDISGFYNKAESVDGSNTVTVYLSGLKNFYVEVNFSDTTVTELKLTARIIDSITQIDLFDLNEEVDSDVWLFNNTTSNGDELKAIEILQPGEFEIKANYNLSQAIDPIFVIIKETIVNYQVVTEVITTGAGVMNPLFTTTLNLEPGKYYIGYFNTAVGEEISIQITRLVMQSGSHVLVTDPDLATPCGSQINIIEKDIALLNRSYRQTFITEGFTRLIYPDFNYGVPASRLHYDWYSSNVSVATVTPYGTVLALPVTTDTTVKIMAVLKADRSKVFVKEFTILNDLESTTYVYADREEMVNDFLDDYTTFYNAHRNDDSPATPRPALTSPVTLLVPGDYGYNVETALVARLNNGNATLELFFEDSDLHDKWIWIVEYTMGIRTSNKSFFEAYINGSASGTNSTVKFEICAFLSERFITTWPQSSNYTIDGFANGFWDRLIVNTINIYVNIIISAGETIAIPLEDAVVPIKIFQYYSWSTNDISYVEFYPWGVVSFCPSAVGQTVTLYGRYCYNPRVVIIIVAEIV